MSKGNTFENEVLLHIFQNAAIALIGDASGLQPSVTAGNLYAAIHTADPGEGGDQTTNEASYTGYARQPIPRSSAGFTVTGNLVENAAEITFPVNEGVSQTVTHFSIGTALSGTGKILYHGALNANREITNGFDLRVPAGDLDITEN